MLEDEFGREVSGVRVSLTDRCNFDCVYCHNEGLGDVRGPMEPTDEELGTDEVVRFLEVAAEFDVEAVKFTGGEPLLRADLEEIVRRTPDSMAVSLTTNGTMLPDRAAALAAAGVGRVNVSQDAIDPDAFAAVTNSGAYDRVIEGVEAALDAGLAPVKLNMVVFEATAGHVPAMVEHVAANDGLQLQLIEYMPEIAGNPEWAIDIERVHDWLAEQAHRVERREMHGRRRYFLREGATAAEVSEAAAGEPVAEVAADGGGAASRGGADAVPGEGMVEIVDPVANESFCANCHRVRLTHDGKLKGCLNRNDDLRSMGETKDEIRATFRETVANRVPYYGEYLVKADAEGDDGEGSGVEAAGSGADGESSEANAASSGTDATGSGVDAEWVVNEAYLDD
ncbi:molybdenum cofactor biosynthesis protein A [Salinarchaeum sp. Harcht-Bsk1]|uniref:GTP 3',8-cyclase MoaA n=1 Tax=Salinarchaeum sp. Harcht-Bsk1 TaxID=1333523 RepID=UPI000342366F|nr:molybdenum cofactor biosynthesis protein A [Salinarchaeum sp. Harcht-Bsk1]